MIEYPEVPSYWGKGNQFMKLDKGFIRPNHVIGFDTESCRGEIISQQFATTHGKKMIWCSTSNALEKFLQHISKYKGFSIIYCFNAKFDLAIIFREFIEMFIQDDFEIELDEGWNCKVFCASNWFAQFQRGKDRIMFLDIAAFFKGSLDKVSKSFGLDTTKLKRPEGLGYKMFTPKDEYFVEYALVDAELCLKMGQQIVDIHEHYDIPIATSAANFAEKVFRRNYLREGELIQYPENNELVRLAELTYHGGKNAYYCDHPTYVKGCYEYDFNAAYGFAMYSLPQFLSGEYKRVKTFSDKYEGVYWLSVTIKDCPYGIAYDRKFQYLRNLDEPRRMNIGITSHELREGLKHRELEINKIHEGYIWVPDKDVRNPIKEYIEEFWKLKNAAKKGDVKYEFQKLLLNSLYGKWIQRNPNRKAVDGTMDKDGRIQFDHATERSGGLYHPFIATLITGFTRSRLHTEEHKLDALEVSTDSVKSRKYVKEYAETKALGAMQMEHPKCSACEKSFDKFNALFVRNRLNLLMCPKGHIMKAALHGFVGKPEHLKEMWETGDNTYVVDRMAQIREGLRHASSGKKLFQTFEQERTLNVDWDKLTIVK